MQRSTAARMRRVIKGKIRQVFPGEQLAELRAAIWEAILEAGEVWPVWNTPSWNLGADDRPRLEWIQAAVNERRAHLRQEPPQ